MKHSVSNRFAYTIFLLLFVLFGVAAAAEVGSFTAPLLSSLGGTGVISPTAHTLPINNGASAQNNTGVGTNGQLVIGSSAADPVWATLGTTTGISITTGAGTLTVNNTGVTSLSAGTGISLGATTGACSITATGGGSRTVTVKTANYSVVSGDSGTFFTTTGAGGTVNFTLPTAAAGLWYTFYVDAAQTLQVTAGTSTFITLGGSTSTSAGNITDNVAGGCVTIIATDSTHWKAISYTMTWTTA